MKIQFLALLILIIIAGCQNNATQSNLPIDKVFFDLADYFKTEIENNQKEISSAEKITSIDTVTSIIQLSTIDFASELKLFTESNINKISWADRYQIDTIPQSNTTYEVKYSALSDKLQTREIIILFNKDEPRKINIHNQLKSMIMDTDQYLTYVPGVGYDINIKQIGKLQTGHNYSTSVKFN